MTKQLTTKGIEVEQYVGSRKSGEILPLSPLVKKTLTDFMTEPDARNVEYATEPAVCYKGLLYELTHNRNLLRNFLKNDAPSSIRRLDEFGLSHLADCFQDPNDEFTILPGSCISHEFDTSFKFSDPNNPYYQIIRDRYQTSIVTASLHINFGMPDSESSIAVSNAVRLIAAQALALSASSPFHNGKVTGYESYRWHSFPQTPEYVPIFKNLEDFIKWNDEQIASGMMFNVRHLWCSIRANGPTRPNVLNRVELRVSDLIFDLCLVLGLTGYYEMRALDFLEKYENGDHPKILTSKEMDLAAVLDANEEAVAKDGMKAKIFDWQTESEMTMGEQLARDYAHYSKMADELEIGFVYEKLKEILENGNFSNYMLSELKNRKALDPSASDDSIIRQILIDEAIKQEEKDKDLMTKCAA